MTKHISIISKPFFGICFQIMGKKFILCFCHHLPERSIKFFGIENYLCARCFGILCGSFVGLFILIFCPMPFFLALATLLPLVIDGSVQVLTKYESTNLKRFITGFLFGIGLFSFVHEFTEIFLNL